jgi:peptidoglycan lytic transglycosylase
MSVSRLGAPAAAARWAWAGMAGAGFALALSGCANQTIEQHYAHGHEYFSQAKYGRASSKVVADGQPVPKGGGQYLVGHPYSVAGHSYYPREMESYTAVGMASWYGAAFHGRRTANGEVYDMASITAAHPTMPLPSYARVTNLDNGYSIIVRVNDRGPFQGGRVMDVSARAAEVLGFKGVGTARIKVEYVGRAPLEGSDDGVLLASLRTDRSPANLQGYSSPVMVAGGSGFGLSLFAALFGSGRGEAARPAPPPPPEPIRVAAAPPPPPEPFPEAPPEPIRQTTRATAGAVHIPRGPIPLPPARPFDLGAAHGASVVAFTIRQPKPAPVAVLPPRRPLMQASAEKALYFSDPPADRLERLTEGAFDRVTPANGPAAKE